MQHLDQFTAACLCGPHVGGIASSINQSALLASGRLAIEGVFPKRLLNSRTKCEEYSKPNSTQALATAPDPRSFSSAAWTA
jgi:hypothetical protein